MHVDVPLWVCYYAAAMSIRFVIGRAGTGKSHRCISAIRQRIDKDPVDGPSLIFLVPEQAALQMERAVISPFEHTGPSGHGSVSEREAKFDSARGANRAMVLSYRRLAYLVLESVGATARTALSEPARSMVLRHLLHSHAHNLQYYRHARRMPGLFNRLGYTISELLDEGVEPQQLQILHAHLINTDAADAAKLHDLHLIYAAYLAFLGSERLDPSQYLLAARPHFKDCPFLAGAEVWVDGFASFSVEETRTLVAIGLHSSQMEITAMFDPALLGSADVPFGDDAARLFLRTHRTFGRLAAAFHHAGLELDNPVLLTAPPRRFKNAPRLAELERRLFATDETSAETFGHNDGTIELVSVPSRRIEVDYAASRILRWVMQEDRHLRFRDLAIIARDLEPYHDLLSDALRARGIPFFLDRRRSIAHHPLVELLRAGPAIVVDDLSVESVRLALKTGLLPLSSSAIDELENYFLAHGIAGLDAWRREWTYTPRTSFLKEDSATTEDPSASLTSVNAAREAFLVAMEPLLTLSGMAPARLGTDWTHELLRWFEHLQVNASLAGWALASEQSGDLNDAEEHRQVWRDTLAFLDDISIAFADTPLSLNELHELLETGLSALTLGLAPPMVDQVLVSSIDRSRHPDIRAAVILGFNDSLFPQRSTENSILNDDDRARFANAGIQLRPPSRVLMLEERLLAYTALTRAAESVVITWPTTDGEGRPLRPSPFVEAVRRAVPGVDITHIADPADSRGTWPIMTVGNLVNRMTGEFASRPPLTADGVSTRARWNSLYELARVELSENAAFRKAMQSLNAPGSDSLSADSIRRLYPGPLRTSVSRLESFAACPFQHFARHSLRLQPRLIARMEPVDVGQWHHAILEDFVQGVAERPDGWRELSDPELSHQLRESVSRVAARLPNDGSISHARDAYVLRRSVERLDRILQVQRDTAARGRYRPHSTEVPFGFDVPGGLPALTIATPGGREVVLRGYIDRLDLAELGDELLGIVIDYKHTRVKRLDLTNVYHGLSLQLIAYLLAIAANGKSLTGRRIRPAAGLYITLVPQYTLVNHPDDASRPSQLKSTDLQPRGLLLDKGLPVLEPSGLKEWSPTYSVYYDKDGAPGNLGRSDVVDTSGFDALLAHTRHRLGELADAVLDGDVAVRPYRLRNISPCSWCELRQVCRFEMGLSDVRYLDPLSRQDVLERLQQRSSP